MANWNKEQTSQFIEILRKYPILWDHQHQHYKNKTKRKMTSIRIAGEIENIRPNTTEKDVEDRFQNLKKQFQREWSNLSKSCKSGSAASETYKPKLWCFEQLMFLRDVNAENLPRLTNIETSFLPQSAQQQHSDFEEPEEPQTSTSSRRKRSRTSEDQQFNDLMKQCNASMKQCSEVLTTLVETSNLTRSPHNSFLNDLLKDLNSVPPEKWGDIKAAIGATVSDEFIKLGINMIPRTANYLSHNIAQTSSSSNIVPVATLSPCSGQNIPWSNELSSTPSSMPLLADYTEVLERPQISSDIPVARSTPCSTQSIPWTPQISSNNATDLAQVNISTYLQPSLRESVPDHTAESIYTNWIYETPSNQVDYAQAVSSLNESDDYNPIYTDLN